MGNFNYFFDTKANYGAIENQIVILKSGVSRHLFDVRNFVFFAEDQVAPAAQGIGATLTRKFTELFSSTKEAVDKAGHLGHSRITTRGLLFVTLKNFGREFNFYFYFYHKIIFLYFVI